MWRHNFMSMNCMAWFHLTLSWLSSAWISISKIKRWSLNGWCCIGRKCIFWNRLLEPLQPSRRVALLVVSACLGHLNEGSISSRERNSRWDSRYPTSKSIRRNLWSINGSHSGSDYTLLISKGNRSWRRESRKVGFKCPPLASKLFPTAGTSGSGKQLAVCPPCSIPTLWLL